MPDIIGYGGAAIEPPEDRPSIPSRIERFRILGELGAGTFGRVFKAADDKLGRIVAIKVLMPCHVGSKKERERFLQEARIAAQLSHPNIVSVYESGEVDAGDESDDVQKLIYVVYQYIDGVNLDTWLLDHSPLPPQAAQIVRDLCLALDYAHRQHQQVIHRDIKPSNILMERRDAEGDKPWITDFGIAVTLRELGSDDSKAGGTRPYRSPEQARGKSHRVTPRSDVFSLGVVLYELLVGPERAAEILNRNVKRHENDQWPLDARIPAPLHHICHRALEYLEAKRYSSARDMAAHLQRFLDGEQSGTEVVEHLPPPRIVPQGLRRFRKKEADVYPHLLDAPKDYDGLPVTISVWLQRIDETDANQTFAVGLIYGPSGCGKSSLIHAGLLPRLKGCIHIDIEATSETDATRDTTEKRLLKRIRDQVPGIPHDLELAESIDWLREEERKTLIVVDQFEQWLSIHPAPLGTEFYHAMRACDKRYVRCLLLVRKEFLDEATAFLGLVDPDSREHNRERIDLISAEHACRVVMPALGRGCDCISGEPDESERQFIEQSVRMLAEGGKVTCVKLALFIEVVRNHKRWTPELLKRLPTFSDVGQMFLETKLNPDTADAGHGKHVAAARRVLEVLLPEDKGQRQKHSLETLREASSYRDREQFEELLQMLDKDLRLITVVGAAGSEIGQPREAKDGEPGRYYQLTHDFLIDALREWLDAKPGLRQRAKRELRRCTAEWKRSAPENVSQRERRYLPGPLAYAQIECFAPRRPRNDDQQALLRTARRYYGIWGSIVTICLTAVVLAGFLQWKHTKNQLAQEKDRADKQLAEEKDRADKQRAETLADSLVQAPPQAVSLAMKTLTPSLALAEPSLKAYFESAAENPSPSWLKIHAAYGLAAIDAHRETMHNFLVKQIPAGPPDQCPNIVSTLAARDEWAIDQIKVLFEEEAEIARQVRYATVALHLGDASLATKLLTGPEPGQLEKPDYPETRSAFIHGYPEWHGDLSRPGDLSQLAALLKDPAQHPDLRSGVVAALGLVTNVEARRSLEPVMLDRYRTAPDGGTHSAARFALTKWNVSLPDLTTEERPQTENRDWFVNSQGMAMMLVPAGKFMMGDAKSRFDDERPVEEVILTEDFYLAADEVTVKQFQEFIEDTGEFGGKKFEFTFQSDPSVSPLSDESRPGVSYPVQRGSWHEAVAFCNWLSHREERQPSYEKRGSTWVFIPGRNGYYLPTEAQWEYACRAGSLTDYCFGDDVERLDAYAYFGEGLRTNMASPVGLRLPNRWGLFDMHGNVREWCNDWFEDYPLGSRTDPTNGHLELAAYRVLRGGSWHGTAEDCRSAFRYWITPDLRDYDLGFRVARVLSSQVERPVGEEQGKAVAQPGAEAGRGRKAEPAPGQP